MLQQRFLCLFEDQNKQQFFGKFDFKKVLHLYRFKFDP